MGSERNPKEIFGLRLRELRLSRGMSQETLAHEAGFDRTYISSCERGKRNISLENIHRLAVALGVPPATLLESPEAE
jgi:transcriptional regulator with XRE-family HTH domain